MDELSALDERRQRAREAALDTSGGVLFDGIDEAIETATRVKITPEIIEAARLGWASARGNWDSEPRETSRLIAAFRTAGFEVEL